MIYVPPFITAKLRRGKTRGQLDAFVLSCELANCEQLSAGLREKGKKGAQELALLLGQVFQGPLEEVERRGGIVARWDGDNFLALFPREEPLQFLAALAHIQTFARSLRAQKGRISPRLRLMLGYGRIGWRIIPNELQYDYLFFGRELERMEAQQRSSGTLIQTSGATRKLGSLGLLTGKGKPARITKPLPARDQAFSADPALREKFLHPRFRNLKPEPEFREVVCTWVKQEWNDPVLLQQVIQDMELIAITFGIFVSKLQKTGSEYCALSWLGIPRRDGKAAYKACRVALDALKTYPGLRHGIATGTVFWGRVGGTGFGHYVVCGPLEKRARQLCELARPGETVTDPKIRAELSGQFTFEPVAKSPAIMQLPERQAYKLTGMPAPGQLRSRQVFIGRQRELASLKAGIGRSLAAGDNLALYVCGEPGIGKTRLAEELINALPAGTCQIFRLWCDPASAPLEPLRQLFRQLFPLPEDLDPEQAASAFRQRWKTWAGNNKTLLTRESLIAAILGLHWPGSRLELTPPELRLARIFEAAELVLDEMASRQALLIHIDDLQWLDPQSREFFLGLGNSRLRRTCILASTRYLEDGSVPALPLANFTSRRVALGPLKQKEVLDLHRALLGVAELPAASVRLIRKKANGNPFAIEQTVALCLERGRVNARGEYNLPENWEQYDLRDVLLFRINQLSAKTRECVYNASVLGMRFNIKVLSQMLHADSRRELASGSRNRFWKDLGEVFYIFSHVLIQEAAYAQIVGEELGKLHLSAAEAMEKVFEHELNEHAEEIALHFDKAGRAEKAAYYYDLAADKYWKSSLFERLESNVSKAMSLSATACGTDSAQYCEYSFHLALLYHYLLRFREAEPLYLEVIRIARQIHGLRSPALSPYLNNLGRFYKDTRRYAKSEKMLRRSLAIERKLNPTGSNVADRINNLGHLYAIRKQFDKAKAMFLEALQIMETYYETGHFFTGTVCGNLGATYLQLGQLGKARKMLNRAVEISYGYWGAGNPVTAIYLANLGKVHQAWKHFAKAETLYLKALGNINGPFGDLHAKTLMVVTLLRDLYAEWGKQEKATHYAQWLAGAE
ncbi:MAG: tetratricopeptide repeat protein [Candidatus Cloacimonetes bacterium]|nr:tetratricopeptide repeat protein [Candidatus Cloacimonadota bacterium]